MSRLLRIANQSPERVLVYAEPEGQELELPRGGALDLEVQGGELPLVLVLQEDDLGHLCVSVWPHHGDYQLWNGRRLLRESGERPVAEDSQLELGLENRTARGIFLSLGESDPPTCLTSRTKAALRFAPGDTQFVATLCRIEDGGRSIAWKSRTNSIALIDLAPIK